MGRRRETSGPRLAGTILCGVAALLLLASAARLFAGEAGGWGAGVLLVVGLFLLLAALKSLRALRTS